jgi:MFS family permease
VNYYQLFRANPGILSFGMMMVFFSSFGQTFVLSLYIPELMEAFGLSSSGFSTLYAAATLLSATTLIYVGKKIDHVPLRHFVTFVIVGLFFACLLFAASWHLVVLFLALYVMRLFGQGLLMHTAMTTLARYFSLARGKALSIAALGFPLGEAIFPVLVAASIISFGWRQTLIISALLIAGILFPYAMHTLRRLKHQRINEGAPDTSNRPADEESGETGKVWTQKEVIRSRWFYLFAPSVFLIGFLQTALFFFQTFIASEKGWTTEWMAGSIIAYASSSIIMSIVAGPLVDKFSARRLFPFMLIPLAVGVAVLGISNHPLIAPAYWLLVGFTGGMNSPITSSIYAETFGVRSLGTVRSIFTFVMVVSTALGPVVYSFFIEKGVSFDQIHYGVIAIVLLNMAYIYARYRKKSV